MTDTASPRVVGLLPCPFCGGFAALLGPRSDVTVYDRFIVECQACEAFKGADTDAQAIAAWNTRPASASVSVVPEGWRTMGSAPRDGTEFWALSDRPGDDLPPFVSKCAWHADAGFCTDELREPILWRALTATPVPAHTDGEDWSEKVDFAERYDLPLPTPSAHTDGTTYQPDARVIINDAKQKGDGSWSTTLAPTIDGKGGGLTASAHTDGEGVVLAERPGWDVDGICNDHGREGCKACALPWAPIPEGMKPWHGGDTAPADWAGPDSDTLLRNGYRVKGGYRWTHWGEDKPEGSAGTDIIAYTPSHTDTVQPSEAGEVERLRGALSDPNAVHINMLRGGIARPSVQQIIHIYGEQALRAALKEPRDER